jgi:hypothetical protein
MPYGTIKVDTITFTDAGVDKSVSISGLVQNPTFTGNVTATGTISGLIVQAPTVTGTTANFASGVYTTQISGAIVKVPAGGAGAPSIQVGVGASVAPGLYGAGTDLLGISTGGAGRIFIDSTGRLGVGTSSPAQVLDVAGNGRFFVNAGSPTVSVNNGTIDHYIGVNATGGLVGTSNSYPVLFLTNNTERLRIDSSGNVGIGTTSPGALLDVRAGSLHVGSDYVSTLNTDYRIRLRSVGAASNNNYLVELGASGSGPQPADSDLTINTQTWNGSAYVITEKMRVTATGNVGIGTTSPSLGLLEVSSANGVTLAIKNTTGTTVGTEFCQLTFNNTSNANANFESAKIKAISTNGGSNLAHLTFENSGTERARIDSSGRVGIGTSSPAEVLHVNGNLALDNGVLNTPKYLTFRANSTGAEYGGIRWFNLQWNGNIRASITSASDGAVFNGYLAFSTGSSGNDATEKMRIDSSGRVGIGTSSPTSSLHVGGGLASTQSPVTYLSAENGSVAVACEIRQGRFDKDVLVLSTNQSLSANLFNAIENGTSRFVITGAGLVGIGTTSPVSALNVSVADGGNVTISNTNDGHTGGLAFGDTSSNTSGRVSYDHGNNSMRFDTAGNERCRLTSDGKWLVGTSTFSGSSKLVVQGSTSDNDEAFFSLVRGTSPGSGQNLGVIRFQGNGTTNEAAQISAVRDGGTWTSGSSHPGRLVFSVTPDGLASPVERMRISNAGNWSVGGAFVDFGVQNTNSLQFLTSNGQGYVNHSNGTSTGTAYWVFGLNTTAIGSITQSGTTGVAYNTSSDYRLKENVVPLVGAIERVNQLQVRRFNFIADPDRTVDGFIAHEAQAVVPECVTGEKDAVDDEGNPVYQGIDQSKLVPLLTAALQEAIAEIESLKGRLTAAGI